MNLSREGKKELFYSILFIVFLLTYMIVLSVTDGFIKALDDPSPSIYAHYLPAVMRIVGFVSFGVSRRYVRGDRTRRMLLIAAGLVFLLSSAGLLLSASGTPVFLLIDVLSLVAGHIGGLIYYCIAVAFSASRHRGKIIGWSCAAAVLLQFLLTGHMNAATQLVFAAVLFLLVLYMTWKTPADYILEDALPYARDSEPFRHAVRMQLAVILSVVFVCALLACRTDIAFVSMSYSGSVDIYAYPRLAMVAGYLILGLICDLCDRRLFPVVFFCGLLLSAVLILMPMINDHYAFFLSVYYFFIAFHIFFYTYCFISIAPRTGRPELWACMGRPLSDLFTAGISFLFLRIGIVNLNAHPILYGLSYFILLVIVFVIMSCVPIDPDITMIEQETEAPESLVEDKALPTLEDMLGSYPLTPREKEVASLLISTEQPIKAIAIDLGISERSVYRFAASIYEKTDTDSRTGLIKKFYR